MLRLRDSFVFCSLLAACGPAPSPPAKLPPLAEPGKAPPPAVARLDIQFTPVCQAGADPTALDVEISLPAWDSARTPVFSISDEQNGEDSARKTVQDISARDEKGDLPLTSEIAQDPKKHERTLFFRGSRAAAGTITLRYRAVSVATNVPGGRFGLRHDRTGIGGNAMAFLVLPALAEPRDIGVTWKPANCSPDMAPTSALGPGPAPRRLVAPPDALRQAMFFFGHAETIAIDRGHMHLAISFLGKPSFDTRMAADYAGRVFAAERALFGDDDPTPYYALMRVLPQMTKFVIGGGNPYGYSSVVGPNAPWNYRMRNHIAHELLHHWIGVGVWMSDARDVSGYWFTEGFTVHYSRVIMLRADLMTPAEYLEHLNKLSLFYYSSPLRGASNEAIVKGIAEPVIGDIPYWRGSFYAAELDAAIRSASKGARSLDHVIRELHRRAKSAPRNASGYPELKEDVFRELVRAEVGDAGVERFDAVVRRGEIAVPQPNAYGPCFDRKESRYGEYELGFDQGASMKDPREVRGLVRGSAAEAAGMAEGDAIVDYEPHGLDPTKEVVVSVRKKEGKDGGKGKDAKGSKGAGAGKGKDGAPLVIRYLPVRPGTSVVGYEWVRAAGVPDEKCKDL